MTKPLRCLLWFHSWRTVYNGDGEPYQTCWHCYAEREPIVLSDYPASAGGGVYL